MCVIVTGDDSALVDDDSCDVEWTESKNEEVICYAYCLFSPCDSDYSRQWSDSGRRYVRTDKHSCHKYGWLRGTVVERWSLTSDLSLSCARPAADG